MSQTAAQLRQDTMRDNSLPGSPGLVPAARPARSAILAFLRSQLCPAVRG